MHTVVQAVDSLQPLYTHTCGQENQRVLQPELCRPCGNQRPFVSVYVSVCVCVSVCCPVVYFFVRLFMHHTPAVDQEQRNTVVCGGCTCERLGFTVGLTEVPQRGVHGVEGRVPAVLRRTNRTQTWSCCSTARRVV